jgi:glycosyltransferase involved in cell wall biosynthesis
LAIEHQEARKVAHGHPSAATAVRTIGAVPLRILHAPADVGGHARGLAEAERELGFLSDVAVFTPGPFGYRADIDLRAGGDQSLPIRFARRGAFLARAIERYDVIHFNFGQTLLQVRQLGRVVDELPLLRRLGKTVIVTFQGCDVRPFAHCHCRNAQCAAQTVYRQAAADRALRYADRVLYLNPDLGRWLPGGRFVPYASFDPRSVEPVPPAAERDELVVLHAPTDRAVKGSRYVEDATATLRAEGVTVRLELVEGVSRDELLRRIADADLVVDQLLIGWYGGFAVEAMALGKPVLSAIDDEINPFGAELPIVRATPATLAGVLRELAADPEQLRAAGLAGRRFVETVHDPRAVARQVLDGLVPAS